MIVQETRRPMLTTKRKPDMCNEIHAKDRRRILDRAVVKTAAPGKVSIGTL